jgi:hypothetical protein
MDAMQVLWLIGGILASGIAGWCFVVSLHGAFVDKGEEDEDNHHP